jgi:hypothetical protein
MCFAIIVLVCGDANGATLCDAASCEGMQGLKCDSFTVWCAAVRMLCVHRVPNCAAASFFSTPIVSVSLHCMHVRMSVLSTI